MFIEMSSLKKQLNLPRYLAEPENRNEWQLCHKAHRPEHSVTVETYLFHSQTWPKQVKEEKQKNNWQHHLILYRPDLIHSTEAILYVNGGTRYPTSLEDNPEPQVLDFA